ncbi:aspartate kinase [Natronospora cellulosivora (SeqCode)]
MSLIVQKYGGSSVANIDKIKNVAERVIEEYNKNNSVVVVVSAMGDTTDELYGLMNQITKNPNPRECDMLLTTGEQVTISLLSMAIQAKGYKAISLTGSQVRIETNDQHNKAEIRKINNSRISDELDKGKIVVVAGFQGINSLDDFTTLGRGGSDTTAVALAASLEADCCEIYSDVDGIYTADPRIVPEAKKLSYISYEEMLELASLGANVLHPRSVELAKAYNMKLYIASSFNYKPGTIVGRMEDMENKKSVTGVTSDKEEVKITVEKIPDRPGVAGQLFTKLAEKCINVDMIIQNLQHNQKNDITFTINEADLASGKDFIEKTAKSLGAENIIVDEEVAKVSIVGAGMITTPGIAAKMFRILGDEEINIHSITTSDIKVSCLISKDQAERAVKLLHTAFDLNE